MYLVENFRSDFYCGVSDKLLWCILKRDVRRWIKLRLPPVHSINVGASLTAQRLLSRGKLTLIVLLHPKVNQSKCSRSPCSRFKDSYFYQLTKQERITKLV